MGLDYHVQFNLLVWIQWVVKQKHSRSSRHQNSCTPSFQFSLCAAWSVLVRSYVCTALGQVYVMYTCLSAHPHPPLFSPSSPLFFTPPPHPPPLPLGSVRKYTPLSSTCFSLLHLFLSGKAVYWSHLHYLGCHGRYNQHSKK